MSRTPLYQAAVASGARPGEYRGVETAALFSSTEAEYPALRSGCGVFDLGWRAKLSVAGPDRARWLNGMVTNNIKDLPLNHGVYCFLLNAQGRIQGDLYAYNRGEHFILDTDAAQKSKLLEIFDKFVIMDDVEISDLSEKLTAIGLRGAQAVGILSRLANVSLPAELQIADSLWGQQIGYSLVHVEANSFELWMPPENAPRIWNDLIQAGATPVGSEAFELARIADGTPLYGKDINERYLPQETGQERALNFSKGCYLGQEIVERIHSRAILHREFRAFTFSGALPPVGAKIQSHGKDVGELTSVASLPSQNGPRQVGLGYVRRESATAQTPLTVEGATATIAKLPLDWP